MFWGMERRMGLGPSASPSGGCSGTFGEENVGGTGGNSEQYIIAGKFQNNTGCTGTSAIVSIYISQDSAATAAKVAIYSDSAGSPNILLGSSAEFNPSAYTTNWYDFEIDLGVNEIADQGYFWLAMWGNTGAVYYLREVTGGVHAYRSETYTGNWPSPLNEDGTGTSLISIHCDITG